MVFLCSLQVNGQDLYKSISLTSENGLSQNTVCAIQEDVFGRIWFGTPNKLHYYNGYDIGTIDNIENRVLNIFEKDTFIYCITIDQIVRINTADFTQKSVQFNERDYYYNFISDQGIVLINTPETDTFLYSFDLIRSDSRMVDKNNFQSYLKRSFDFFDYTIAIGNTGATAQRKNEDTISISKSNCVNFLKLDSCVYIASIEGLLKIGLENNNLTYDLIFEGENTEQALLDRNGNLWVGTAENGIYMIHRNALNSNYFKVSNEQGKSVACWTIFQHRGQEYVCTSNGIILLSNNLEANSLEEATKGMTTISAISIENAVLIGTPSNGIFRFKENAISPVYRNPNDALSNSVLQFIPNSKGILAASKSGFIQLDGEGNFLHSKQYDEENRIYPMHVACYNESYRVASTKGMDFVDSNLTINQRIDRKDARVFSMSANFKNEIWVSSLDGGLFKLDNDSLIKVPFPDHHLLSLASSNESLWISSSTSLYQYRNDTARPYGMENGLPIFEYNQNGVFKREDQTLFFAGVGGVIAFSPEKLEVMPYLPNVRVSKINDSPVTTNTINLAFDVSTLNLNIEPIILTDKNLFEISYRYQKSPNIPINEPQLINLDVPYGSSQLNISVKNRINGEATFQTITIQRETPIWKKTWFKIILLILVLLSVAGIYILFRFIQTKRKLKRMETIQKIEKERLRISNELHDNIGARLTHIISSLDIEMYKQPDGNDLAAINLFARETMTQLRETIWAVNNKTIFFSEFSTRVKQYIEQINKLTKPTILYTSERTDDYEMTPVEVINFYRIVQEAVNNSVKYANAQNIEVSITQLSTTIQIQMRDDGQGFAHGDHALGTGIKGMQSRAKEANAELIVNSEKNIGTTVILIIKTRN